jgi:hypothetical protein
MLALFLRFGSYNGPYSKQNKEKNIYTEVRKEGNGYGKI